jgi:sulfotransferase
MKNFGRIVGLAGLPRSGSTLFGAILNQNPDIHSEGTSPVCQLMWDMQYSCRMHAQDMLAANYKTAIQRDLVASIPKVYYKNVKAKVIVDKCRAWTDPNNFRMLNEYLHQKTKVIVLTRSLTEVLKSCLYIKKINNQLTSQEWLERSFLEQDSDPIINSWNSLNWAKNNNHGQFLFISYDEILNKTEEVLDSVYNFIELPRFNHDLSNIIVKCPENDDVYACPGMHYVRPKISKRKYKIELSDWAKIRIKQLECAS